MNRILNIFRHLQYFCPIWVIVLCLVLSGILGYFDCWTAAKVLSLIALGLFLAFIVYKPMNLVYGLIGTKGDIRIFVILLVFINLIFSFTYYFLFFSNAGITYDINQPHIAYNMFAGIDKADSTVVGEATIVEIRDANDSLVSYWKQPGEVHNYQKIEWPYVLKNTLMTSLMQEPSDFFAIASTYNTGVEDVPDEVEVFDYQKSKLFHWLLILQVFISWIFFGVFISILYNKFRYES